MCVLSLTHTYRLACFLSLLNRLLLMCVEPASMGTGLLVTSYLIVGRIHERQVAGLLRNTSLYEGCCLSRLLASVPSAQLWARMGRSAPIGLSSVVPFVKKCPFSPSNRREDESWSSFLPSHAPQRVSSVLRPACISLRYGSTNYSASCEILALSGGICGGGVKRELLSLGSFLSQRKMGNRFQRQKITKKS